MKDEYDFSQGQRGPVIPIPKHQTKLTILIDNEVFDWFRQCVHDQGGGDYLAMINEALREHKERKLQQLQDTRKELEIK